MQNLFQIDATDYFRNDQHSRHIPVFDKKIQILNSSVLSILFKFCRLVVTIQISFWTFTVSSSNGNKKELGWKICVKSWCCNGLFLVTVGIDDIRSLTICNSVKKCLLHRLAKSYNQQDEVTIRTNDGMELEEVSNFKYLGAWSGMLSSARQQHGERVVMVVSLPKYGGQHSPWH